MKNRSISLYRRRLCTEAVLAVPKTPLAHSEHIAWLSTTSAAGRTYRARVTCVVRAVKCALLSAAPEQPNGSGSSATHEFSCKRSQAVSQCVGSGCC